MQTIVMSETILELFTHPTTQSLDWQQIVEQQSCPLLNRTCVKIRKSQPNIAIGTCSVQYGTDNPQNIIICPHRFLERGQIFMDCIHLLTLHEPGNELHKIAEVEIPGGSVDYFLVSVRNGKVADFVGIELQALDTTGTVWPFRQKFLADVGILPSESVEKFKPFGMNWKMTAKTTLVQMHHKIETFENLGKHLVLVLQDSLMNYMRREFNFAHIQEAKLGHAMPFHAYGLDKHDDSLNYRLKLNSRASTDAVGMSQALGLQASANVELDIIIALLQRRLSDNTLLKI
jgi:hypothetical protein